ncbi:MAG TPA: Nif3-like dinuclear metal center hexameric protein [Gemmatimonadaceae bacterium]
MADVHEIASHLDAMLRSDEIPDYGNALNGIQVDSDADIVKVAAAVDARERTILGAISAGANLLIVHHGLFWGGLVPLRGAHVRRVRLLLGHDVALYSAHLPLDAHPQLGNNVLLARELGLTPNSGFARYKTIDIGVAGQAELPTAELVARADRVARQYGGAVRHSGFAEDRMTSRWAICTGAGASAETLHEAAERNIDTLIVGEGPHWTAVDADELGITIIYAGHYATETLGVQALAAYVAERYDVPWHFIDVPTGL